MRWSQLVGKIHDRGQTLFEQLVDELRLLADMTQLNRRTRMAWQRRRVTRACYLLADHQRRRIARRRAIRRLVEG